MKIDAGDQIIRLIGADASESLLKELLESLDIVGPNLDDTDDDSDDQDRNWNVWYPKSTQGLEIGFQDNAYLNALTPDLRGDLPLIFTSVCFYGLHDSMAPYAGQLPFGIDLSDSRDRVRQKLCSVEPSYRRHRRDVWDLPALRIVVSHDSIDKALSSLLCIIRPAEWPKRPTSPDRLPSVSALIALFGHRWFDSEVQKILFPLGLDACGRDIVTRKHADLRMTAGLELGFSGDRHAGEGRPLTSKGDRLSSIRLYRTRYLDSREWRGELPFGLQFRMAYPAILKNVGREPDRHREDDLSGFALWHLPEYSLHVLYSNVGNEILCVSLFAPGVWQDLSE